MFKKYRDKVFKDNLTMADQDETVLKPVRFNAVTLGEGLPNFSVFIESIVLLKKIEVKLSKV